jgi:hypothetical protein
MLYVFRSSHSGEMLKSWASMIFRNASFGRAFIVPFFQHSFSPYRISEPHGTTLQHLVIFQCNRLDWHPLPGVFPA